MKKRKQLYFVVLTFSVLLLSTLITKSQQLYITSHNFGKGLASYVGLPAKVEILNLLTDDLIKELPVRKGPDVPAGVMARQIDPTHILYLNVTGEEKEIPMKKISRSVLRDKDYRGTFTIAPYEPEFIENSLTLLPILKLTIKTCFDLHLYYR